MTSRPRRAALLAALLCIPPLALSADDWGGYDPGNLPAGEKPSTPAVPPTPPPAPPPPGDGAASDARTGQEQRLQGMSRTSPEEGARLAQAQEFLGGENPEQAFALTAPLARAHPDDPNVLRAHAIAADAAGHPQEAREAVARARELAPENLSLQELEKLLSRKVPAADDGKPPPSPFDASGSHAPVRGSGAPAAIPRVPSADGGSKDRADLVRQGLSDLQIGDPRAAEERFTQQLGRNPRSATAYRLRSLARRRLKDYAGAFKDADEAVRLDDRDGWNYKTRAVACGDLGRYDEARADIARALELNGRDADAFYARAQIWKREGRRERRLDDLRRAAELDKSFESAYRQALAEPSVPGAADGRTPAGRYGAAALLGLGLIAWGFLRRGGPTTTAHKPEAGPALQSVVGYEVIRKLGQGGMGEVWEAMDRGLERRVAIKRMRAEISGDPRERRRFLKEARTVAALKHPNIVEIHSVLEAEGGLYLVFEHVAGEPLHDLIARKGRLSPAEFGPYFGQIAAALDYAHAQGVVHQDLKPANIMVSGGTAKVMDFGIARRMSDALSTLSRSEVLGTPDYMAPEQEQGLATPRSDVFALGVCLYEALTGCRPFHGAAAPAMKLNRAFTPPSAFNPDLPAGLDGAVAAALEPDPAARPATAGEFARLLEASSWRLAKN